MRKLVFFGCNLSSYLILKYLINKKIKIEAIFTKKKSYNHDFVDLKDIAKKNKIQSVYVNKTNSKRTINKLKKINPDYLICIGWPVLFRKKILSIPKKKSIGFHPSELPKNRGRHPIIWSIVLGLKYTASSFFLINSAKIPDSGNIISQKKIYIKKNYSSKDLYLKIISKASYQLLEIINKIKNKKFKTFNYKKLKNGNVWRKRSEKDGEIDWRMNATSINRLTRALSPPYPYAYFIYKKKKITVFKTETINSSIKYFNIEPGRVVLYQRRNPVIKCSDKLLKIYVKDRNFNPKKGESLV